MPWKRISCENAQHHLHALKGQTTLLELDLDEFKKSGEGQDKVESRKEDVIGHLDYLYDGLPDVELSLRKAKEIMGENFFGHESYEKVFGILPDLDELGRVPFSVSELRKAKEKGMRLIVRYDDGNAVAVPSAAALRLDDLGINIPREHQIELTKKVENGWVLVGERGELTHLFEHAQLSWEHAVKFLGLDPDPDAHRDVERATGWIKEAMLKNEIDQARGLLKDLMANVFSKGNHFLVKANEAIYDALMVSNGDQTIMQRMLGPAVTGSVVPTQDNNWEFLKLDYFYGTSQNFDLSEIQATTHGLNRVLEDGMRYQIRV